MLFPYRAGFCCCPVLFLLRLADRQDYKSLEKFTICKKYTKIYRSANTSCIPIILSIVAYSN